MTAVAQITEQKTALELYLHPLVIINISDQHTREKVRAGKNVRVYGVLLGVQTGRRVSVINSFEMIVNDKVVDTAFVESRKNQYNRVWEDHEILGWYATGQLEDDDLSIHQQIEQFNESPFFLLLDAQQASRSLPITILETTLKSVDDKHKLVFTKVAHKIETTEAERIAVDHVANVTSGGKSLLTAHLSTMHGAIKMLNLRIKILAQYLRENEAGNLPRDEGLLRSINALCHLLPAIDSEKFKEDFLTEYNDALLITYLSSITKTSNAINEMIEKFNITFDGHTRRRGYY